MLLGGGHSGGGVMPFAELGPEVARACALAIGRVARWAGPNKLGRGPNRVGASRLERSHSPRLRSLWGGTARRRRRRRALWSSSSARPAPAGSDDAAASTRTAGQSNASTSENASDASEEHDASRTVRELAHQMH